MDPAKYKSFHEDFMQNHSGSAAWESWMVLTSIPLGVFLTCYASPSLHIKFIPFLEFFIIIFPVILNVTVSSGQVYLISFMKLFVSIFIFYKDFNYESLKAVLTERLEKRKNCITNYRSSTNFVSVLCILAVDFMVFPRRFAKTEKFGFGLMDLGVGFFVCSNGIIVKNLKISNDFRQVFKGTLVLICLGLGRLVTTKSLDYHEHTSEYGVHWNFFFTLAFCKLFPYFLVAFTNCFDPLFLTIFTAIVHECFLYVGLQDWVFSDVQRNSLLSANREGISSLLGYVSLYFAAVSLGNMLNQNRTYGSLLLRLSALCVAGWIATGFVCQTVGVSRKLANVGYNLWVISLTVSVMIQFIAGEIVLQMIHAKNGRQVPELFESINVNGLFYFLFGNILTGIINLTFQTLLLGKWTSVFFISLYKSVLCSVSYFFYKKNVIIKFW